MLAMIVALGLIHGLGLSTRLQELPLNESELLLNIISFNLGIELGQILALSVMLLLLTFWRKKASFKVFSTVSNYGLIFLGGLLFMMQMHGYSHGNNPDEFAFSSDNHFHEHMKMDAKRSENNNQNSTHDSLF